MIFLNSQLENWRAALHSWIVSTFSNVSLYIITVLRNWSGIDRDLIGNWYKLSAKLHCLRSSARNKNIKFNEKKHYIHIFAHPSLRLSASVNIDYCLEPVKHAADEFCEFSGLHWITHFLYLCANYILQPHSLIRMSKLDLDLIFHNFFSIFNKIEVTRIIWPIKWSERPHNYSHCSSDEVSNSFILPDRYPRPDLSYNMLKRSSLLNNEEE